MFDPKLSVGTASPPPPFSADNLFVVIRMKDASGQEVTTTWFPGKANQGRTFGTVRTLDNAKGVISLDCDTLPPYQQYGRPAQLCTYGLVSRAGWVLVDDTVRPRFDNDPEWPWVMSPPSLPQQDPSGSLILRFDWYLFGHGVDYRAALGDFVKVAGKITMPPRFGLGVYFSRWWPFADVESMDIINEYQSYSIPLDGAPPFLVVVCVRAVGSATSSSLMLPSLGETFPPPTPHPPLLLPPPTRSSLLPPHMPPSPCVGHGLAPNVLSSSGHG
jgi:hypothetical protein